MASHTKSTNLQKETNRQIKGGTVKNTLNSSKTDENLALEAVIGVLNAKRWNQLKASFFCETNECFATKLLDLAQEHLSKYPCKNHKDDKNQNSDSDESTPRNNKRKKNEIKRDKRKKNEKPPEIIFEQQNSPSFITKNLQQEVDIISLKQKDVEVPSVSIKVESQDDKFENEEIITKHPINAKPKKMEKGKDPDISKETQFFPQPEVKQEAQLPVEDDLTQKKRQTCNIHSMQDRCPFTYPTLIVSDAIDLNKYKKLCTKSTESFAKMSLPNLLELRPTLTDHGLGVFTKIDVQQFSQFGPLIGENIKAVEIPEDSTMRDIWEIRGESQNIYFNTEDLEASNWIRFVRPAPVKNDANIILITRENLIFFVTTRKIKAEEELLYWYDSNIVSINKKKNNKTYCGSCYRNFSNPIYYGTHCSVFHDIRLSVRKYHCKVCGVAVVGKKNISKHAAEMHNGEGAFQCQFCKKYFLTVNNLEVHRNYGCSSNPQKSKLLCDLCGRKFSQPQRLRAHIKSMHSDSAEVLEFQCKHCLKVLGSKPTLQRHIKEVHQKQSDDACACSRCGRFFQNKCNLKIHMLTHSGVKPFKCEVRTCNSAFTTKQWLQVHYKKVHKFSESQSPKIERKVEFTLEAYSGFEDEEEKIKEMEQSDFTAVKLEEDDIEEYSDIDSKILFDPLMVDSPLSPAEKSCSSEKNEETLQNIDSKQFDPSTVKLEKESQDETGTFS